jgi:hypothetical protein
MEKSHLNKWSVKETRHERGKGRASEEGREEGRRREDMRSH